PADRGNAPGLLFAFTDSKNFSGLDIDGNFTLPLQAVTTRADVDQGNLVLLVNNFPFARGLVGFIADPCIGDRRQVGAFVGTPVNTRIHTAGPDVFLLHAADKEVFMGVIHTVAVANQLEFEVHTVAAEVVCRAQADADEKLAIGGESLEVALGQDAKGLT